MKTEAECRAYLHALHALDVELSRPCGCVPKCSKKCKIGQAMMKANVVLLDWILENTDHHQEDVDIMIADAAAYERRN